MLFLSTNQPVILLLLSLLSLFSLSNATVAVGRGAPASGPVYILGTPSSSSSGDGAAAVARVGSALRTLGFPTTYLPFLADDDNGSNNNATTYYDHYAAIISREPGAKFILPADSPSPSGSSWLRRLLQEKQRTNGASLQPRSNANDNTHPHTLALRALFSQPAHSQQLLELRFDGNNNADSHQSNSVALPPSEQLQAWEQLCDFLGLGYSVVERLKLRRFP
ncbi:hypothetical protein BFW01_g10294 [Lasiodiplodia theobromae]|uniref:Uncharacterized protein n=1 Tax=Lasiodiplodia theobromae TaxID=45133 RepID=A0A8H7MAK6_9PEZI|nr:hypothetical protein BFW01_g10294 [Lasiodiplodia theobromae]